MSRLILIGATAVVLIGVLFFVLLTGGGRDTEPELAAEAPVVPLAEPIGEGELPAGPAAPALPSAIAEDHPTLASWTAALEAAGIGATYEDPRADGAGVFIRNVVVTGPPEGLPWRWTSPVAAVRPVAAGRFEVQPTAPFAFHVTVGGTERSVSVESGRVVVRSERGADGVLTALAFSLDEATIRRGASEPITVGSGMVTIALEPGTGIVPAGSTIGIFFENMVVPAMAGGGLGTLINVLTATIGIERATAVTGGDAGRNWIGGLADATLAGISVRWGRLDAEGTGMLTFDAEGRPEGEIRLAAHDLLTVLDAIHSVARFDQAAMADVYAALLLEMRDNPSAALPLTIALREGEIVLAGAPRGTQDLILGTVGPILP